MIIKVDRRLNASTCKEMRINARKEKEKISCVQDEQVEKVNNLLSLGAKVSVKGKRPDKRYIYIYIYKGLGKLGVPFKV